jgi:hypothetical protein
MSAEVDGGLVQEGPNDRRAYFASSLAKAMANKCEAVGPIVACLISQEMFSSHI